MKKALIGTSLSAFLLAGGIIPASAWDRGRTEIFAILPELPGGPVPSEGLTVGPDGTVYAPSFGINSHGAVPGPQPNSSTKRVHCWSLVTPIKSCPPPAVLNAS